MNNPGYPKMTPAAPDILGLGCTAIDDLVYVGEYPAPDSKMQVQSRERHCGGITATALVAAARLGSSCAFAGVLGEDELSRFVLQRFEEAGVSTAHVRCRPEARPIHSIIIVDESRKTRTILYDLEGAFGGARLAQRRADSRMPRALRGPFRHGGDDSGCQGGSVG